MKFFVVIDPSCFLARAFAGRLTLMKCEPRPSPAFACSTIDMAHPWYIRVSTLPTELCPGEQSIHIPHRDVQAVLEYDSGEPTPLGFV